MAASKKSTAKVAAPKAAAKPKRNSPKPPAEVLAKLERLNMELAMVMPGDTVKVYNHGYVDYGTIKALQGTVVAVHEGFRIDVLVMVPGAETESLPTVNHISQSDSPSDLFWDK